MAVNKKLFILILMLITSLATYGQRRFFASEQWVNTNQLPSDTLVLTYRDEFDLLYLDKLDINTDVDGVINWGDRSGNNRDATQTTSYRKPSESVEGYIHYDGTQDALIFPTGAIDVNKEFTIFMAFDLEDNAIEVKLLEYFSMPPIYLGIYPNLVRIDDTSKSLKFTWKDDGGTYTISNIDTLLVGTKYLMTLFADADSIGIRLNGEEIYKEAINGELLAPYGNAATCGLGASRLEYNGNFGGDLMMFGIVNGRMNASKLFQTEYEINTRYDIEGVAPLQLPFTENLVLYNLKGYGITANSSKQIEQWDDLSGNNNHTTQTVTGNKPLIDNYGNVVFDGVDDYLTLPDVLDLGADETTILIVIERDPDTTGQEYNSRFFSYSQSPTTVNRLRFLIQSSIYSDSPYQKFSVTNRTGSSAYSGMGSDTIYTLGSPHLVTYSFLEGDSTYLKINGANVGSSYYPSQYGSTNERRIGQSKDGGWEFKGKLKLVAVYNRKLTPIEIATVEYEIIDYFNLPIDTFSISSFIDNELIAGWKLDTFYSSQSIDVTSGGAFYNIDSIECILGTNAGNSSFDLVDSEWNVAREFRAYMSEGSNYSINIPESAIKMRNSATMATHVSYVLPYKEQFSSGTRNMLVSEYTSTAETTGFYNNTTGGLNYYSNNGDYASNITTGYPANGSWLVGQFSFNSSGSVAWDVKKESNNLRLTPTPIFTDLGAGSNSVSVPTINQFVLGARDDAQYDVSNIVVAHYILAFSGKLSTDEFAFLSKLLYSGKVLID